jgi:hypothetical protein
VRDPNLPRCDRTDIWNDRGTLWVLGTRLSAFNVCFSSVNLLLLFPFATHASQAHWDSPHVHEAGVWHCTGVVMGLWRIQLSTGIFLSGGAANWWSSRPTVW